MRVFACDGEYERFRGGVNGGLARANSGQCGGQWATVGRRGRWLRRLGRWARWSAGRARRWAGGVLAARGSFVVAG